MSNSSSSSIAIPEIGKTIGWFSLVSTIFTLCIFATHEQVRVKARLLLFMVASGDFIFSFSIIFLTYSNQQNSVCTAQVALIIFGTYLSNIATCTLPTYIACCIWLPLLNKKRNLSWFLKGSVIFNLCVSSLVTVVFLALQVLNSPTDSGWFYNNQDISIFQFQILLHRLFAANSRCFIATYQLSDFTVSGSTLQFLFYHIPVACWILYLLLIYPVIKMKLRKMGDLSEHLRILNNLQFIGRIPLIQFEFTMSQALLLFVAWGLRSLPGLFNGHTMR